MIQTALMSRVPHRRHTEVRLQHSSIRRSINRVQKRHPWIGVSALTLAALVELTCLVLYIVAEANRIPNSETESGRINIDQYRRGSDMFVAQTTLSIIFLLEWTFMFVVDDYKKTFVLSGRTIVMILTVLPQLILAFGSLADDLFESVWVPLFLRIWWLYYFLDELLDSFQGNIMTDLHRDLMRNVLSLFSTMITCIGIFHACELFTGESGRISLFESMYFIVVTFGTIGYGDYYPTSTFSRMVTIVIMVVAIYRFPLFFSNLAEIARLRARYTSFKGGSDEKVRHVIVAGTLGDRDVSFFLNEFFSGARQFIKLKIVLLSDVDFTQETRLLVSSPGYAQRVTLVIGSPTKRADLERCRAGSADAIFLVGDSSELSAVVDYGVVVRALSIHQFDAQLPQHVMLKRERNSKYLVPIVASVMVKEKMKMSLLGLGAVLPGIIPLLVNLFRTYDAKSIEMIIEEADQEGGGAVGNDGNVGWQSDSSPIIGSSQGTSRSPAGRSPSSSKNAPFGGGSGYHWENRRRPSAGGVGGGGPTGHSKQQRAALQQQQSQGSPWLLEYEWSLGCELYTFDTPDKLVGIPFIAVVQALSHFHVVLIGVIRKNRTVVLNPARRLLKKVHRLVFIAEDDRKVSQALDLVDPMKVDTVRFTRTFEADPGLHAHDANIFSSSANAPHPPAAFSGDPGPDPARTTTSQPQRKRPTFTNQSPTIFNDIPTSVFMSTDDAAPIDVEDDDEIDSDEEDIERIKVAQQENDPDNEMFATKPKKKPRTEEEKTALRNAASAMGIPLPPSVQLNLDGLEQIDSNPNLPPTRSDSKLDSNRLRRPSISWALKYGSRPDNETVGGGNEEEAFPTIGLGSGLSRRGSQIGKPQRDTFSCYKVLLPEDIVLDSNDESFSSDEVVLEESEYYNRSGGGGNHHPNNNNSSNFSNNMGHRSPTTNTAATTSPRKKRHSSKVRLEDHYVLIDLSSAFSIPEMSEDARFEADHFAGMDLFNVLQPIKSRDDEAPIVLLARNENNLHFSKLWKQKRYDPIHVIHGCGLNISDLKLCNLSKAKAVVVFSTGECADDNADAMSMLVVLAINSLLRDAPRKVPVLVEVETTESLPLFPPYYTEDKMSALAEANFSFEPNFITGSCITGAMLDPALYQTYFNPELLRIVDALTSGTGRSTDVPGISALHITPDDHVGPTFGDVVDYCLAEGAIPIALYRIICDTVNEALNGQRYIFCNPPRSAIRRDTDIVYYISM